MVSIFQARKFFAFAVTVVLSVLFVALIAQGVTYVDTDSVGVATATPGGALGIKGAAFVDGFVSANYYTSTSTVPSWLFGNLGIGTTTPGAALGLGGAAVVEGFVSADYYTSTSTANSWILGNLGLGTTTPGTRLAVLDDADIAGVLTAEDHLKASFLLATSTTATSTISSGLSVASNALVIYPGQGRMAIGTTTLPGVSDGGDPSLGTEPTLTISGSASTTLFISNTSGTANVGSAIILKDSDGDGCSMIQANNGVLTSSDVECPQ